MSEKSQALLAHHGVRGMRWGVRKGSSGGGSSGGSKSGTAQRTHFQKPGKNLSDAELSKRIKRIEMEKKYNELKQADVSPGKKAAKSLLGNVGKQVVTGLLVAGTMLAISAALGKAGKPGLAKGLTGKDAGNLFGASKTSASPVSSFVPKFNGPSGSFG